MEKICVRGFSLYTVPKIVKTANLKIAINQFRIAQTCPQQHLFISYLKNSRRGVNFTNKMLPSAKAQAFAE